MTAISAFQSGFSFNLKRYIRSPALLFTALAAPIAAHYMLPNKEATYAVLTINEIKPVLTAPVLGLELGVVVATLLTPLAYIFLRAGPTRHRPWQVMDVSPHSRAMVTLGRWLSDTCALWLLLAGLTLAGLILGIFRLEGKMNVLQTIIALWLPAAPALALVAAIRMFLDSRNLTRRWVGDVVFFIIWLGLLMLGTIGGLDPKTHTMTSKPLMDAFGFTAPVIGSVDYPVNGVVILGPPSSQDTVMIDGWKGVMAEGYILSRFVWLAIASGLALVAGLIWAPMKTRVPKVKAGAVAAGDAVRKPIKDISFAAPREVSAGSAGLKGYLGVILSEIKLMLKSRIWVAVLGVAALIGFMTPFRTAAGPIILLAIIFPLTEASARWQGKTTGQLLNTLGPNRLQRSQSLLVASVLLALIVLLPVTLRVMTQAQWQWLPHIFVIGFLVPAFIVAMGFMTRSPVAGRLLMLIGWYVYLSSASL